MEEALVLPRVSVLGSVEEQNEHPHIGEPVKEIIQKLFRSLIDPVEILDSEDEGPVPALPDQEIPDGLEDSLASLHWFQLEILLVFHFEKEQLLEGYAIIDKALSITDEAFEG